MHRIHVVPFLILVGCVVPAEDGDQALPDSYESLGVGSHSLSTTRRWSTRLDMSPETVRLDGSTTHVAGEVETVDGRDIAIREFDGNGALLSDSTWGGTGDDTLAAYDVSGAGRVLFAVTAGPIDFGGGPLAGEAVLVKFDATGAYEWGVALTRYVSTARFTPRDVALAEDGQVAILGTMNGPIDCGDGTIAAGGSAGDPVPAVALYDTDGTVRWAYAGDGLQVYPGGVEFDGAGRVVYEAAHRFGYDLGPCSVSGTPYRQPHVMAFEKDGSCALSVYWPVSGLEHASLTDLAVTSTGIAITGSLPTGGEHIDFGGGPLIGPGKYLVHIDNNGNHVFSRKNDVTMRIATSGDDRIYAAGSFSGKIDLGGGPLSSGSGTDGFVAEYSAGGAHLDSVVMPAWFDDQTVADIAIGKKHAPHLVGQTERGWMTLGYVFAAEGAE